MTMRPSPAPKSTNFLGLATDAMGRRRSNARNAIRLRGVERHTKAPYCACGNKRCHPRQRDQRQCTEAGGDKLPYGPPTHTALD